LVLVFGRVLFRSVFFFFLYAFCFILILYGLIERFLVKILLE